MTQPQPHQRSLEDRQTLAQFIQKHGIRMTCERWHENPNMHGGRDMDHWKVTFRRGEGKGSKRYTTYFSMGFGHAGQPPTAQDVLRCLADDVTDDTFEDWASDMGWDTDSRKALQTYQTCKRQSQRVKRWLGADVFEELVYHTERE